MAYKYAKKKANKEYEELKKDLRENSLKNIYAFYGDERYLLEYYFGKIKESLIDTGFEEFNYKRIEGKGMTVNALSEAVDALPVFAEKTLIEIRDFDFSKCSADVRDGLLEVLSDVPEYACVVFVFNTVEFKLDARIKANAAIKKLITAVEFKEQERSDLINWIGRHFKARGKSIDSGTAEYLAFVCGGMMTGLVSEIDKVCAYTERNEVTREDIDAVVIPVADAEIYKLTDAVLKGIYKEAMELLYDLLSAQVAPHRIIYGLSSKMRGLLAARVCIEERNESSFMELSGIKYEFQARTVMSVAGTCDIEQCRKYVLLCSETAYKMNSSGTDYKDVLTELLVSMAAVSRGWSS